MFRKSLVLALALCAATAFAMPKPSEVKAAFAAGNYAKAESMLREVMAERPTAPVHYQLGQVYAKEGKHNLALNEFRQAQVLDPSIKFASSASAFTQALANEQALVTPLPTPTVSVAQAQPTYSIPVIPTQSAPAVAPESGGHGVLITVVLLLLAAGVGTMLFMRKKESVDAGKAQSADMQEKTKYLLAMAKQLEDSILIAKTSSISDADKALVLGRITALQTSVRNTLADIKDGKGCSSRQVSSLQAYVDRVVDEAQNGVKVEAVAAPVLDDTREYTPKAEATVHNGFTPPEPMPPAPSYAPSPTQSVFHHYPTPAPAPVIVNNSNDGLLTGVILGSMMNRHEDRTVYVERERQIDTPRYERDTYEAPAPAPAPAPYYAPSPAPALDTSSDDRDDYSAPDNSSSMDSSPSSDDTY